MSFPSKKCLVFAAKTGTLIYFWPFLQTTGTSTTRYFRVYAKPKTGTRLGTHADFSRKNETFLAGQSKKYKGLG